MRRSLRSLIAQVSGKGAASPQGAAAKPLKNCLAILGGFFPTRILANEQTVIDHQATILNYFNSRLGEFFGDRIMANPQLHPD